jgi:NAD+ kinase
VATVAIFANPANEAAVKLAASAGAWLQRNGHRVRTLHLHLPDKVAEDGAFGTLSGVDLAGCTLAMSLGGDGTFLRMVPLAHAADIPVLGVNFGHLGYLLQVEPPDVATALEQALRPDAAMEERCVLSVVADGAEVPDLDEMAPTGPGQAVAQSARHWVALNEVVAERTYPGHTVRLATAIDGEPFLNFVADGVLVATPTGSTAYNLSAGGPVLAPHLRSLVMTPIAPHLGFDRSVVLDVDQAVSVTVEGTRPAVLVVDGRTVAKIPPGSAVTCRTDPVPVRFVCIERQGFGTLLRQTLAAGRDR